MKVHIAELVDLSAKRGGWPSHSSLLARCGRGTPQVWVWPNLRKKATCKACLKAKV